MKKVATGSAKSLTVMTPQTETELAEIIDTVKDALRSSIETIYKAGRELVRAKKILGHGSFLPWLEKSFGASARTAQHYMRVAEKIGDKYEAVSHLPPATVYEIAYVKKADDRAAIVNDIEAKKIKTPADVTKAIDALDKRDMDKHNAAIAPEVAKAQARPGYRLATAHMICSMNEDPIGRASNLTRGLKLLLGDLLDFGGNAFECLETHTQPTEERQELLNVLRQIQQAAAALGSLRGAQGYPTGRRAGLDIKGDEAVTEEELPSEPPIPVTPIGGRLAA